jgi:hypothetical protein
MTIIPRLVADETTLELRESAQEFRRSLRRQSLAVVP